MIVFALRHADRITPGDGLSAAGQERAALLARMLTDSGVSMAFCSDAIRATSTIEPLRQELDAKLTIKVVGFPPPSGVDSHITTIVDSIKALPADKVVAVISHSNTVGEILVGLGSPAIAPIKENEFDKLFVLSRDANGTSTLAMLRYGAPT